MSALDTCSTKASASSLWTPGWPSSHELIFSASTAFPGSRGTRVTVFPMGLARAESLHRPDAGLAGRTLYVLVPGELEAPAHHGPRVARVDDVVHERMARRDVGVDELLELGDEILPGRVGIGGAL